MNLATMFLLFIMYSFLGWCLEVVYVSIKNHRITARGFLIGPCCPIYGTGALLMTIFLDKYQGDIFVLFLMSCFVGVALEYFTSYIMEKLFKTRWWDYSDRKYNINGRICLENGVIFGVLGVLLIEYINPMLSNIIESISPIIFNTILMTILVVFITDIIISFKIISNIKKIDLSDEKDTTEEIRKKVHETLKERSVLSNRLINAFPNLKIDFARILKKRNKQV